ncbi:bile acid:sodium symporter family protein [Methyloprofundus sp.]|uniref:bile acid:sodium symporter family protein n=1 Tax=Methyloprofundus sp. TaxID=2020875 RepID=UPI003D0FB325
MIALFPISALLLSFIAYLYPTIFVASKSAIIPLLALVMFFMGMTLRWQHFKQALQQPLIILLTIGIQFLFMPLFAYLLANALQLSEAHTIGLVLVGCSAGGTASNVICYLANGNVALSILMTMASTLCAVVAMPLLSYVYLSQSVSVPVLDMMRSILLIVFIPVLSGTAINSFFARSIHRVQGIFPVFSSLAIVLIIAIIVALNQQNIASLAMPVLIAVALHNLLGMTVGYFIPRLFKYDTATCRTVSIEVGMQNSGLSVALAMQYFSAAAALPGAIFSIWHNVSGSTLSIYWRQKTRVVSQ